ncbi:hypothetical protein [Burkholderia vietnamiensis]|uniref:hypothetical protein n=1 Tax=Burkholderia vietnamiensis TaxID=60552 RepID=UPI000B169C01|nr:hypothetical protein [Burkholderia vietnamiensis]
MTTTILSLDLGTTTGWALRGSDGNITSGSESFRPQRAYFGEAEQRFRLKSNRVSGGR